MLKCFLHHSLDHHGHLGSTSVPVSLHCLCSVRTSPSSHIRQPQFAYRMWPTETCSTSCVCVCVSVTISTDTGFLASWQQKTELTAVFSYDLFLLLDNITRLDIEWRQCMYLPILSLWQDKIEDNCTCPFCLCDKIEDNCTCPFCFCDKTRLKTTVPAHSVSVTRQDWRQLYLPILFLWQDKIGDNCTCLFCLNDKQAS